MIRRIQTWGIRTRLYLAFGVIAGLSVASSVVAALLLGGVGETLRVITRQDVPRTVISLELAGQAEALVAFAPNLLNATTADQRQRRGAELGQMRDTVARHLSALAALADGRQAAAELSGLVARLNEQLTRLDTVVGARQANASQREAAAAEAKLAHAATTAAVAPAAQVVRDAIEMASMNIGGDPAAMITNLVRLTAQDVPLSQALAALSADGNHALSLLIQANQAQTAAALLTVRQDWDEMARRMAEKLDIAENLRPTAGLRPAVEALLALGVKPANVFALREADLRAMAEGRQVLTDTRSAAAELSTRVETQVAAGQAAIQTSTDASQNLISFGLAVMIALVGLSVALAALIGWLYIGRSLVARVVALNAIMGRLSDGDLTATVAPSRQADEISRMAATVSVFRDNMIRAERLTAEQQAEHAARESRAARVDGLTHGFEGQVGGLVGLVASAAAQLQTTARSMTGTAGETAQQAANVASAAEEASVNVQTVASAAEELAASITEISRQVAQSAKVAGQAVEDARRTDTVVRALADGARSIGEVVGLISNIAGQTNLLALNATIEAARAGDAGKGFAVVASEVKSLATQTARATEDIGRQIAQIQNATREAVASIEGIGSTIGEVSAIAAAIAAAVEQQGAATQEIARNTQQASAGTLSVTTNISGVGEGAQNTGAAATEVLGAAGTLSRQAEDLNRAISRFIADIKAA